jgi:AAA lid domain
LTCSECSSTSRCVGASSARSGITWVVSVYSLGLTSSACGCTTGCTPRLRKGADVGRIDDGSESVSYSAHEPVCLPTVLPNLSFPRASQYLVVGTKARAVLSGRFAASVEDVRALARPVLRHRVLPNFTAESEGLTSVKLIDSIVERIKA